VRAFLLVCLLLTASAPAAAQDGLRTLTKGQDVLVRIPPAAFQKSSGFRSYDAAATVVDSAIAINRNEDWEGSGFVDLAPRRVAGLTVDRRKGTLRIDLHRNFRRLRDNYHLVVPLADTAWVIPRFFVPLPDSAALHTSSYSVVAAHIFGPARDSIPQEIQDALLGVLDSMLAGDTARMQVVDGRPYLRLWVRGESRTPLYDSDKAKLMQLLTWTMGDVLYPVVTMLAGEADSLPGSFGFGITMVYETISGLNAALSPQIYQIPRRHEFTVFAPADAVARLARGRATGQEFVDACVVEVKGKGTIRVILTP